MDYGLNFVRAGLFADILFFLGESDKTLSETFFAFPIIR